MKAARQIDAEKEWKNWVDGTIPQEDWVDGTTPQAPWRISNAEAWAPALAKLDPKRRDLMITMIDLFSVSKTDPKGEKLIVDDSYLRALTTWVGPGCFSTVKFGGDYRTTKCETRAGFLKRAWPQKWMQPFHDAERDVPLTQEDAQRMGWAMATLPGPTLVKGFQNHAYSIKLYYKTNRPQQPINITIADINFQNGKMIIPYGVVEDMSNESKATLSDFIESQSVPPEVNTMTLTAHVLQQIFQMTAGSPSYSKVRNTFSLFVHPDHCDELANAEKRNGIFIQLGIEDLFEVFLLLYRRITSESSDKKETCSETFKLLNNLYEDPFVEDPFAFL